MEFERKWMAWGVDWVSGNIPNAWLSIWKVALTFNKKYYIDRNRFKKQLGFSCMLETNRPTQNDRNDHGIISWFW